MEQRMKRRERKTSSTSSVAIVASSKQRTLEGYCHSPSEIPEDPCNQGRNRVTGNGEYDFIPPPQA
jgi:hypothetical protein